MSCLKTTVLHFWNGQGWGECKVLSFLKEIIEHFCQGMGKSPVLPCKNKNAKIYKQENQY
jgi:hypothetical protein